MINKVSQRFWITAAAITAAVYFFVSYHPAGLEKGAAAPHFSLLNEQGQTVTLQQFRGKVVLVHFWATWCGACVEEMPELTALAQHFRNNPNFVVLGLSLDDAGRGGGWLAVRNFAKQNPLPFTVLMDAKGQVADQFGTYALPETYLVDRQGQISRKWAGGQDWSHPELTQIIEAALSSKSN